MSPSTRTRLYYFSQLWTGGAFHSYGGIWFASLGFSAMQIGLVNTVPTLVVLLTNILVGKLADRAKDWRQVLIICSTISLTAAVALVFTTNFHAVFLFWSIALITQTLAVPVGDAAASYLEKEGRGSIGKLRALSTLGYIASLFATGYAMQGFGGGAFAVVFAGFTALRTIGALFLPRFKPESSIPRVRNHEPKVRLFSTPWLLLPLLGWAIAYATLQVLNSFLALILKQQGVAESTIGWLIGWGAVTEAIVFFAFTKFSHLLDLRGWILISCMVTVVRWIAMANTPAVEWLFVLQTLHGISFALGFVACVSYIARHTSSAVAAEAQSAFNFIQMAVAIVVVTAFGGLLDRFGASAFYVSAVVALVGSGIALSAFWFNPPAPTAPALSALPQSPA